MSKISLILTPLFLIQLCFGQSEQTTKNIIAFAKLYGYVKYFHPSDEASSIDWNKFAIYGVKKVEKINNTDSLCEALNQLFQPIAPSICISKKPVDTQKLKELIIPPDTIGYHLVIWQHLGDGLDYNEKKKGVYKSGKINPRTINYKPKNGNVDTTCEIKMINKLISEGIFVTLPITLYKNMEGTYPKGNKVALDNLKTEMNLITESEPYQYLYVADLLVIWNVFQHFYPYEDELDRVAWEKEFGKMTQKVYTCMSKAERMNVIEEFLSNVKDSHIYVMQTEHYWCPPVKCILVNDTLIVQETKDSTSMIKPGWVIKKIDGIDVSTQIEFMKKHASYSNESSGRNIIAHRILAGRKNSTLTLLFENGEQAILKRVLTIKDLFSEQNKEPFRLISEGIVYVNLSGISEESMRIILPLLTKAKSVIFDLREYPDNNYRTLLPHLLNKNDSTKWMYIPLIVRPDYEGAIEYMSYGWSLEEKEPHIGAKCYFLVNGRTQSYGESYTGMVQGYKLGTIIGEQTAGTNGNVNFFTTPSHLTIRYTGMKVTKLDGSPQHCIGFIPDILIKPTKEGVKKQKDEVLEYTIKLAKEY